MLKHPKRIFVLFVWLFVLVVIFQACRKMDFFRNQRGDAEFTIKQAKNWWYADFRKTSEYKNIDANSIFVPSTLNDTTHPFAKMPSWKRGKTYKVGDFAFAELPLSYSSGIFITPEKGLSVSQLTQLKNTSLRRLLLVRDPSNKITVRIVEIIPDYKYAESNNFDISRIKAGAITENYSGFSGWIYVRTWGETYKEDWRFDYGKINRKRKLGKNFGFRKNTKVVATKVEQKNNGLVTNSASGPGGEYDPCIWQPTYSEFMCVAWGNEDEDADEPAFGDEEECTSWISVEVPDGQPINICEENPPPDEDPDPYDPNDDLCIELGYNTPEECLCLVYSLPFCNFGDDDGPPPPPPAPPVDYHKIDSVAKQMIRNHQYTSALNYIRDSVPILKTFLNKAQTDYDLYASISYPEPHTGGPYRDQVTNRWFCDVTFPPWVLDYYASGIYDLTYVVLIIFHEFVHVKQNLSIPGYKTNEVGIKELEFEAHYLDAMIGEIPPSTKPKIYNGWRDQSYGTTPIDKYLLSQSNPTSAIQNHIEQVKKLLLLVSPQMASELKERILEKTGIIIN